MDVQQIQHNKWLYFHYQQSYVQRQHLFYLLPLKELYVACTSKKEYEREMKTEKNKKQKKKRKQALFLSSFSKNLKEKADGFFSLHTIWELPLFSKISALATVPKSHWPWPFQYVLNKALMSPFAVTEHLVTKTYKICKTCVEKNERTSVLSGVVQ